MTRYAMVHWLRLAAAYSDDMAAARYLQRASRIARHIREAQR